jgi:hypothetical protein
MNRSLALSRFVGLALSVTTVACGGRVGSGPGNDQNGVFGEAGSSSTGPVGANAITISLGKLEAYYASEDQGDDTMGEGGSPGADAGPDPRTIVLQVTNAIYTCQKPDLPLDCGKSTVWVAAAASSRVSSSSIKWTPRPCTSTSSERTRTTASTVSTPTVPTSRSAATERCRAARRAAAIRRGAERLRSRLAGPAGAPGTSEELPSPATEDSPC